MTTMTADQATAPAFARGDGIPFTRLLRIELRKMLDTRAGTWLIAAIGLITVAALVIVLLATDAGDRTYVNALAATATPQALLLPVLGILLVTQEWGQRTGMVTFTLEPHRAKVLWAKVIAAVVLGIAAMVLSLALAAVVAAVGGASAPWSGVTAAVLGQYLLLEVLTTIGGLVFGLLFLNTAAAIVVSFALPIGFTIVTGLWSAVHKAQPWIDPSTAQGPLQTGHELSTTQWAHLGTASLIWVIVPFAVGMWRVLRAEVK